MPPPADASAAQTKLGECLEVAKAALGECMEDQTIFATVICSERSGEGFGPEMRPVVRGEEAECVEDWLHGTRRHRGWDNECREQHEDAVGRCVGSR